MNISKIVFITSSTIITVGGAFLYGTLAYRSDLPPIPMLRKAHNMVQEVVNPSDRVLETVPVSEKDQSSSLLPNDIQSGLVLVAGDVAKRETAVRIINRDGRVVHEWRPVWSEVWGKDEGKFYDRPVKGTYLHGMEVLPDGSLVANFDHQSTFRMDPCGNVLWKLDNLGHHSVHHADDGTLWVGAEEHIASGDTGYPNHKAPLDSWTLQNISLDGEILRTIPVIDVLMANGLEGLLYMSRLQNKAPVVTGDTLHLNDIETFPADLTSEIFDPGDLLISLRNISAVLVFAPHSLRVKFLSIGGFMRQHDPDFMPGDIISVFDNRNFTLDSKNGPPASRIVEIDARTGAVTPVLEGTGEEPFFTEIFGKHQRLENGNILVVASGQGRVLEFTPDGRLAWRYNNRVGDRNMRVYMAAVLPSDMDEKFFMEKRSACENN